MRDAHGPSPVHLAGGQGSHVMCALAAADALAVVPEADDRCPPAPGWSCGGSTGADSGRRPRRNRERRPGNRRRARIGAA